MSQDDGVKWVTTTLWIPSDIPTYVVCSFPKSGRTWLRYILAGYLNKRYLSDRASFKNMYATCPNCRGIVPKTVTSWRGFHVYPHVKMPLVVFCHDLPNKLEHEPHDLIVLIRNPYDALISYHKHWRYFEGAEEVGDLDKFLFTCEELSIGFLIKWYNHWADLGIRKAIEDGRRVLLLSYEELSDNTLASMRDVVEFIEAPLGPVDEPLLEYCVELGSFDNMQAAEVLAGGIYGKTYDPQDDNKRRVRQGKVGGYKSVLTRKQYDYIHDQCEAQLSEAGRVLMDQTGFSHWGPPSPRELQLTGAETSL